MLRAYLRLTPPQLRLKIGSSERLAMPRRKTDTSHGSKKTLLSDLMSAESLQLLSANGVDLIRQIGFDVVREILLDVLTGRNLRDSTEVLTRRRIAALNLAIVSMFLKGSAGSSDFVIKLPHLASDILTSKGLQKSERWLAQWILGLTDKGFQNILRDDPDLIENYRDRYIETCREIISDHERTYGELTGLLKLGAEYETEVNWLLMTYLLNTIGAETLTIRGSDKSAYGKLFEKLVLGSLLYILGFRYEPSRNIGEGIFWLSTQDEKRESDATLIYKIGQGVRFDIGFIGRGNPEISLDKVTRFEHQATLGKVLHYMATVIIVDRIGKNSRIVEMAETLKGDIVQMSASYWPQQVVSVLRKRIGFTHELEGYGTIQS